MQFGAAEPRQRLQSRQRPQLLALNLIPQEYRRRAFPYLTTGLTLVVIGCVLLLYGIFYLRTYTGWEVNRLTARVVQAQDVLRVASAGEATANQDRQRTEIMRADYQSLTDRQVRWSRVLAAVSSLPPGVSLTSLNQTGFTVTISGNAPDYAAAVAYLEQLRASDLFANMSIELAGDASPAGTMTPAASPSPIPTIRQPIVPVAPLVPVAPVVPAAPIAQPTSPPFPTNTPLPISAPTRQPPVAVPPTRTPVPAIATAAVPTMTLAATDTPAPVATPLYDYAVDSKTSSLHTGNPDVMYIRGKIIDASGQLIPNLALRVSSQGTPSWSADGPSADNRDGTFNFVVTRGKFSLQVLDGRSEVATDLYTGATGQPDAYDYTVVFRKTVGAAPGSGPTWTPTGTPNPTATPISPGQNIANQATIRVSNNSNDAHLAVDGDTNTLWSANAWPVQSIELDFPNPLEVDAIELVVAQNPAGATTHEMWIMDETGTWILQNTFTGTTNDGDTLAYRFSPIKSIQKLLFRTISGPSFVAWREIRVYQPLASPNGTDTPTPSPTIVTTPTIAPTASPTPIFDGSNVAALATITVHMTPAPSTPPAPSDLAKMVDGDLNSSWLPTSGVAGHVDINFDFTSPHDIGAVELVANVSTPVSAVSQALAGPAAITPSATPTTTTTTATVTATATVTSTVSPTSTVVATGSPVTNTPTIPSGTPTTSLTTCVSSGSSTTSVSEDIEIFAASTDGVPYVLVASWSGPLSDSQVIACRLGATFGAVTSAKHLYVHASSGAGSAGWREIRIIESQPTQVAPGSTPTFTMTPSTTPAGANTLTVSPGPASTQTPTPTPTVSPTPIYDGHVLTMADVTAILVPTAIPNTTPSPTVVSATPAPNDPNWIMDGKLDTSWSASPSSTMPIDVTIKLKTSHSIQEVDLFPLIVEPGMSVFADTATSVPPTPTNSPTPGPVTCVSSGNGVNAQDRSFEIGTTGPAGYLVLANWNGLVSDGQLVACRLNSTTATNITVRVKRGSGTVGWREIRVIEPFATPVVPAPLSNGPNIAAAATVLADANPADAAKLTDGDPTNYWSAGSTAPPVDVEFRFSDFRLLDGIEVISAVLTQASSASQTGATKTTGVVSQAGPPSPRAASSARQTLELWLWNGHVWHLESTFDDTVSDGQVIPFRFKNPTSASAFFVRALRGPGPIAYHEIRAYEAPATGTVTPTSTPQSGNGGVPTPVVPGPNIASLATPAASTNSADAVRAIDGDPSTYWSAGQGPIAWIQLSFANFHRLAGLELVPAIVDSAGQTIDGPVHEDVELLVWDGYSWENARATYSGDLRDGQVLAFALSTPKNASAVYIRTLRGPDPVAWREVRVFESVPGPEPLATLTPTPAPVVTRTPTPQTPAPTATPVAPGKNIADQANLSASAAAERARLAVDGKLDTYWSATGGPIQSFRLDYASTRRIAGIELVPALVGPAGVPLTEPIALEVEVWLQTGGDWSLAHTFQNTVAEGQLLGYAFPKPVDATGVIIRSTRGPETIAWREIRVYEALPPVGGTPTPTVPPTATPTIPPTATSTVPPTPAATSTPTSTLGPAGSLPPWQGQYAQVLGLGPGTAASNAAPAIATPLPAHPPAVPQPNRQPVAGAPVSRQPARASQGSADTTTGPNGEIVADQPAPTGSGSVGFVIVLEVRSGAGYR